MKLSTVCLDCPDRFPGCHGSCEKYLEAKAELEAKKAVVREQQLKEWDFDGFEFSGKKKAMKLKRGRQR